MTRVLVVGAGRFGYRLAVRLTELGCDVVVVDRNPRRLELLKNKVASAMQADALDRDALLEVGCDFDIAVVAIGDNFETSILTTLTLKEAGIPYIVGRASTPIQGEILKRIGSNDVVMPEEFMGKETADIIFFGELPKLELTEKESVIQLYATESLLGKKVSDIGFPKHHIELLFIKRGVTKHTLFFRSKKEQLIKPSRGFTIEKGDILVIFGRDKDIAGFSRKYRGTKRRPE